MLFLGELLLFFISKTKLFSNKIKLYFLNSYISHYMVKFILKYKLYNI